MIIELWNWLIFTLTSAVTWGLALGVILSWLMYKCRGHDVTVNLFLFIFICVGFGVGCSAGAIGYALVSKGIYIG